jgi:hypothetical protein
MRLWPVVLWSLSLATSFGCLPVRAGSLSEKLVLPAETVRNEKAVLKYLWPALDYGEKVGRIYYSTTCEPHHHVAYSFPHLNVRPPSNGKNGLVAVREIFRSENAVSVDESYPDVIRVRIGSVPDDILRVRISNPLSTRLNSTTTCPQSLKSKMRPKCAPQCWNLR